MPELVRDNCSELLRRQRFEVWQSEHQVVARSEQAARARDLDDAGVRLAVDQDLVHPRAANPGANVVDHLEELPRIGPLQRQAARRVELHVQRTGDHQEERTDRDQQLEQQPRPFQGQNDDQNTESEEQDEQRCDERVPEGCEQDNLAAVGRRVFTRLRLQPANERFPPLVIHDRSLPTQPQFPIALLRLRDPKVVAGNVAEPGADAVGLLCRLLRDLDAAILELLVASSGSPLTAEIALL
jgi:hypothetical protein